MLTLTVPDMSCGHCVATIEKAIRDVDAAARIDCDLAARRVSIDSAATPEEIRHAIADAGYDISDAA